MHCLSAFKVYIWPKLALLCLGVFLAILDCCKRQFLTSWNAVRFTVKNTNSVHTGYHDSSAEVLKMFLLSLVGVFVLFLLS